MKLRITLAALAAATIALSTPALASRGLARGADGVTMTNDGHYVPRAAQSAREPRHATIRSHRAARRARDGRGSPPKALIEAAKAPSPGLDANGNGAATENEAAAWAPRPLHHADRGFIQSKRTGARATVSASHSAKFQALLDDLEDLYGAKVYYMGGWRAGGCPADRRGRLRHQHQCNAAVDFCQDARGVVSQARDCHLPPPDVFHKLVIKHHLHDGSVWCDGDFGHVQAWDSGGCNRIAHGVNGTIRYYATMTGALRSTVASARAKTRRQRVAHRHHRQRHVASAG